MTKWPSSRIFLTTLILWLCLASLIPLPINNGVGLSALGFFEIDLEDYGTFDETDTDDDFLGISIEGVAIAGSGLSKLQTINLDHQSALLPPDPPPPKQS